MKKLRDEIGKQRPFEMPEEEAYLNIRRTAALLDRRFNRLFKKAGLSEATYNVLRILRSAGSKGKCWSEIRDDLVVPVPDVTRLIDRLVANGHAERTRSTTDRRRVFIRATEAGRSVVDGLDTAVQELLTSSLGHMSADELGTLSRLLERARDTTPPLS